MTPPETSAAGPGNGAAARSPAVSACPDVLRRRAEFVSASRAQRQGTPGFLLQARQRGENEAADPAAVRVGYTCSRKVGNAVTRNRAKRRLRAVVREVLPALGRPGWDYVLVGRPGATVGRPFADLAGDLRQALRRIHGDPA